ncbi:hypothetical protein [Nocardia nova]|uniref:hypothetical protein n=1 Tax=Nocardia nova TaxID=37330 RepID=UPI0011B0EE74|nr:hypothetical protein [Nocardia nova]
MPSSIRVVRSSMAERNLVEVDARRLANLTGIVDLTMSRLDSSLFVGTQLEGRLTGIEAVLGRTVGVNRVRNRP